MIINKKIFLTGGAGFIGTSICLKLFKKNEIVIYDNLRRNSIKNTSLLNEKNVVLIKGDVLDFEYLKKVVDENKPDIIIHLAAIAGVENVIKNPIKTMHAIIIGTSNILKAIEPNVNNIERFVNFSSSEVFGRSTYKAKEEHETNLAPVGEARWTYSISKLAAEHLVYSYYKDFGLKVVNIRPFNVYGPGQVGEGAIHVFITRALKNKEIQIHGDGDQIRSWCYIDDLINGIILCLEKREAIGELFNIGNPRGTITILSLVQKIIEICKSKSNIVFVPKNYVDVELRIPSIEKAKQIIGYETKVDLDKGLKSTIGVLPEEIKMLNVTLIFPNYLIRDKFGEPSDPPLGIAYIAAVLEKKGYNVSIIDANAENLKNNKIRLRLMQHIPEVVGICCNYSPLHNPMLQTASIIKKVFNVPVIVGGNHATATAKYILKNKNNHIDYIIRGEGEETMSNLLDALQGKIKINNVRGITYKQGNSIISTPDEPLIQDLNKLPMPAYHLLPMRKYTRYNVISSRGCPYNCTYCASNIIFKQKVRCRSVKNIVNEIEFLISNYPKKHIWFSDDTFTTNLIFLDKLMDELIMKNLDITWSCLTRLDTITKNILIKMKKAGCTYISYGIESGNQKMLLQMNKQLSLKKAKKALINTKEAKIKMFLFFLVGNPNENWETIKDSYRLIIETKPNGTSFAIVIPLPGTMMWNDLFNKKLIDYDSIKWDYLFAKIPGGKYEEYAANLASKWSNLKSEELIKACRIGEALPLVFQLCKIPNNLPINDKKGILNLYSKKVSSKIKDKKLFIETVKLYLDLQNPTRRI